MPIVIPGGDNDPVEDSGAGTAGSADSADTPASTGGTSTPGSTDGDPVVVLPPVVQQIIQALTKPTQPVLIDIADVVGFGDAEPEEAVSDQTGGAVSQALILAVKLARQHEPELLATVTKTAKSTTKALQLLFADAGDALTEEAARKLMGLSRNNKVLGIDYRLDDPLAGPILQGDPPPLEEFIPGTDYDPETAAAMAAEAQRRLADDPNDVVAQIVLLDLEYDVELYFGVDIQAQTAGEWAAANEGQGRAEFVHNAYDATVTTAAAFEQRLDELSLPGYVPTNLSRAALFRMIMGPVHMQWSPDAIHPDGFSGKTTPGDGYITVDMRRPIVKGEIDWNYIPTASNLVHEFGHVLDWRTGGYLRQRVGEERGHSRDHTGFAVDMLFENPTSGSHEAWADEFMMWVYDAYTDDNIGRQRKANMEGWLAGGIATIVGPVVGSEQVVSFVEDQLAGQDLQMGSTSSAFSINDRPYGLSYIPSLGSVARGQSVNIIGKTQNPDGEIWYLVESGGAIGWVIEDVLEETSFSAEDVLVITDQNADIVEALTGRAYRVESAGEMYDDDGDPDTPPKYRFLGYYWSY